MNVQNHNFAARAVHLLQEPRSLNDRSWMRELSTKDSVLAGPAAALVAHSFLEELDRDSAATHVEQALHLGFYSRELVAPYAGTFEPSDPIRAQYPELAAAAANLPDPEDAPRDPLRVARDLAQQEPVPLAAVLAALMPSPFRSIAPGLDPNRVWDWLTAGRFETLPEEQLRQTREKIVQVDEMEQTVRTSVDVVEKVAESEMNRLRAIIGGLSERAQSAAAGTLIDAYSKSAADATARAEKWTTRTILAVLLALLVAALLLLETDDASVGESIARGAITLTILALAGFCGRVASHERRDARSWTHMELQIATSQAYIQGLPEKERADINRTLAMGFFPGQSQDPHGETRSENVDLPSLLQLVAAAQKAATPAASRKPEAGNLQ